MTGFQQELMTAQEAARWFRRSASWLRLQTDLLRVVAPGGQPLFHVGVCRGYILARLCGLEGALLREAQVRALAAACGLERWPQLTAAERWGGDVPPGQTPAERTKLAAGAKGRTGNR